MKTIRKMISHKKKLSRKMGIYGYGRKKYNSILKTNNMKKKSIKIMRGGSGYVNPNVNVNTNVGVKLKYIPPNRRFKPNVNTNNIDINDKLKNEIKKKYYRNIPMKEYQDMITNNIIRFLFTTNDYELLKKYYNKYINPYIEHKELNDYSRLSYNFSRPKSTTISKITIFEGTEIEIFENLNKYIIKKHNKDIKYTVYYIYPNPNDHENPYIYCIHENTNQNITVELSPITEQIVSITPLELSVDTMQLAINTPGCLQIIEPTKEDPNTYLGFVNFPSLIIKKNSHSYNSSRLNAEWINVYEDESFNENDTYEHMFNINSLDKKEDKYVIDEKKKFSNLTHFNEMKEKIMTILEQLDPSSSNYAELNKQLAYLYSNIVYGIKVKLEDSNKEHTIIENISYVMKNALWLEKYLEIKSNSSQAGGSVELRKPVVLNNEQYLLDYNKLKDSTKYDCDLSGLDEKYIIVDEFINTKENGGDGLEYVICGYPDQKMKEHILNFWQLNKELNNDLTEYIANFFDNFQKKEEDKINYNNTSTKGSQLYKLYLSKFFNNLNYVLERYKEIYETSEYFQYKNQTNVKVPNKIFDEYDKFKKNFVNNYNLYYQQIALKYLKKPMHFIKYVFLIFKKEIDGKLVPMVFNMKELKQIHQPVLQRVDKLIKKELSYRFDILDDDEYNNSGKGNDTNSPFDNEYKLWYSGFTNGNMFHISAEYVHTMSNISRKAHYYLNFKTLEEIIYSCGLPSEKGNTFLQDVKVDYQVREYKINNYKKKDIVPNRTERIFALYEEDKLLKQFYKEIILKPEKDYNQETFNLWKTQTLDLQKFNDWKKQKEEKDVKYGKVELKQVLKKEDIPKIKVFLMFKTSTQEYTFIYLLNGEYYKLVIKSNMSNISQQIIIKFHELYQNKKNTIIFTEPNQLFTIVSNELLDNIYFTNIFKYNPLIYYRNTTNFNGLEKINPNNYFENQMIKNTKQILNYGYFLNSQNPQNSSNPSNSINQTIHKSNTLLLLNLFNKFPILVQNFLLNDYYIKMVKKYEEDKQQDLECNTSVKYDDSFFPCNKILNCNPQETINCIHINIDNCKYNFIEKIDNNLNKIIVYILPYGMNMNNFEDYRESNELKINNPYLSNNRDLDDRSIHMLNKLQELYVNNNKILCFLHQTSSHEFMCLHFHIIPEDEYKRRFPKEEVGTYMSQSININTLINNILSNSNYYKNSNFSLIRQQ